MQFTLDVAQLIVMAMAGLIGIVWHNLRNELARIENDAKSRLAQIEADAKQRVADLQKDIRVRSEKSDSQIARVESEQADVLKSIADLKVFFKDALAGFKLDLVQNHPNKSDLAQAMSINSERFATMERDIRELVTGMLEKPQQQHHRRRVNERE